MFIYESVFAKIIYQVVLFASNAELFFQPKSKHCIFKSFSSAVKKRDDLKPFFQINLSALSLFASQAQLEIYFTSLQLDYFESSKELNEEVTTLIHLNRHPTVFWTDLFGITVFK